MKSTINDLAKRGYVTKEELEQYQHLSKAELTQWLNSKEATKRTIAATYFSATLDKECKLLLNRLKIEKSLYTKMAICENLQKGNQLTAQIIIGELGKIGDNQHSCLPTAVSKKKSYPLPRDIIARTLARMDIAIFPVLINVLHSTDNSMIQEVLDAIGLMVFYNPSLNNEQNAKEIYLVFERFKQQPLIIWKALQCLSAFSTPQSIEILKRYATYSDILGLEAQRSLDIIQNRK